MEKIKAGMLVKFLPDNKIYEVEDVEIDVVYLIDTDGSSFTATEDEIKFEIEMVYTRRRMLESFKQLEMDTEGNLNNMKIYHNMDDKELAKLHKETFDHMYN